MAYLDSVYYIFRLINDNISYIFLEIVEKKRFFIELAFAGRGGQCYRDANLTCLEVTIFLKVSSINSIYPLVSDSRTL